MTLVLLALLVEAAASQVKHAKQGAHAYHTTHRSHTHSLWITDCAARRIMLVAHIRQGFSPTVPLPRQGENDPDGPLLSEEKIELHPDTMITSVFLMAVAGATLLARPRCP